MMESSRSGLLAFGGVCQCFPQHLPASYPGLRGSLAHSHLTKKKCVPISDLFEREGEIGGCTIAGQQIPRGAAELNVLHPYAKTAPES